jgi:hypothetical protein
MTNRDNIFLCYYRGKGQAELMSQSDWYPHGPVGKRINPTIIHLCTGYQEKIQEDMFEK